MFLQKFSIEDFIKENLFSIVGILIALFTTVLILAILIFRDARKRNKNATSWFFIVFFFGYLGAVIYYSKRRGLLTHLVRFGIILTRIGVAMGLMITFLYYGIFPLTALSQGIAEPIEIWPYLSISISVLVVFGTLSWIGASNRIGALTGFLSIALSIFAMWDPLFNEQFSTLSPGFEILKWIILALMFIGGFTGLFNFISMSFTSKNTFKEKWAYSRYLKRKAKQHRVSLIIGISLVATFLVIGPVSQAPSIYTQKITIQPKDYDAEIAFWAALNYDLYSDTQKDALNRYNATLVIYHPPNVTNNLGKQSLVDQLTSWKNNYPNVKFVLSVQGITKIRNTSNEEYNYFYNTFPWDGSADGVIYWSKELLNVTETYNLTNVIGLNVDLESPDEDLATNYGIDIQPNLTRHQKSVQLYNEFLSWFRTNYPDKIYTATMGMEPVIDALDGDWDLQVLEMSNTFEIEKWNEIAPMIYRCGCAGTPPYGDVPRTKPGDEGRSSAYVYNSLKFLEKALMKVDGNTDRIGIYLGITNCTCYGRDVEQYDKFGKFEGYGFDELVKDALIAKHFGCKTITLFILNSVATSSDPDAHIMGGVFDSYGDTFLDDFMEKINGVNSTKPFTIYMNPNISLLNDFNKDLIINIGKTQEFTYLIILMCILIILSTIMHPTMKNKISGIMGKNNNLSR
ncbi:MAG: hypothetical protein ACTSVI_07980 [Promethearchaeota archaeon]